MLKKSIVIVIGGNGSLGRNLIKNVKKNLSESYKIISIDHKENEDADSNIISDTSDQQYNNVISSFINNLNPNEYSKFPVSAIFCCAGGWQGGSTGINDGIPTSNTIDHLKFTPSVIPMWEKNVLSATLAASLGFSLKPGGLMVFISSSASLIPTPTMASYGMAKAAVNHLVLSIAMEAKQKEQDNNDNNIIPTCVVALLPETLDTPMNRISMPSLDNQYPNWTSLDHISNKLITWLQSDHNRPISGSFINVKTRNYLTTFD